MVGDLVARTDAESSSLVWARVVGKSESFRSGLYNPHTASGTIVIDDIVATTFTDTLPPSFIVHSIVTMPMRLLFLACKAMGATTQCDALNHLVLKAYFTPRWSLFAAESVKNHVV